MVRSDVELEVENTLGLKKSISEVALRRQSTRKSVQRPKTQNDVHDVKIVQPVSAYTLFLVTLVEHIG